MVRRLVHAVSETTDHGYLIRDHIAQLLAAEVIWAPGLEGGTVLLPTRGGDYALHLAQDLSIGYLSHDADTIELYLQESWTFLAFTAEARLAFPAS